MLALIKTLGGLLAAAVLAAAGLLVPSHVRSVDPAILALAGDRGLSVSAVVEESLNAAQVGPAARFLAVFGLSESEIDSYRERMNSILSRRPEYAVSGGPDAYFENFLLAFPASGQHLEDSDTGVPVIRLLLPRGERRWLVSELEHSGNANVAALLSIRNLQGLLRLHPADHAAGAPFEAGLLSLAVLIEGGHFSTARAQEIGSLALQADSGEPSAIRAMEELVTASLSLGRRLDFRSLANLAAISLSLSDWTQMGTLMRTEIRQADALYTAFIYGENPAALYKYLTQYAESGKADLKFALRQGPGGIRLLLETQQPIHKASAMTSDLQRWLLPYRPRAFTEVSLDSPPSALALKFALLFLAGLAFSLAMGAAWRASIREVELLSRANPMIMARDVLIAMIVALTLWTFYEPDLLKSAAKEPSAAPRIEFAVADTLSSLKSPVKTMQELNQVTLLVLALFFIIQLVIYVFCLIKLKEIAKQRQTAEMKIRLLENEENLFDFGLYVGLGGTVLALILVAVGIVEASLMAAYASTLFGILFTALLKVLHLRPFRRGLILEAGNRPAASENLMTNIEL